MFSRWKTTRAILISTLTIHNRQGKTPLPRGSWHRPNLGKLCLSDIVGEESPKETMTADPSPPLDPVSLTSVNLPRKPSLSKLEGCLVHDI